MKTVKVTKKNEERLVNELEAQLRERLFDYKRYGVSKVTEREVPCISITIKIG